MKYQVSVHNKGVKPVVGEESGVRGAYPES